MSRKLEQNTLTNRAWEELFESHNILEHVKEDGIYKIKAKDIRKVREPRLMAKFDHRRNLPYIFTQNKLSILPLSRSEYIIGDFNVFQKVNYDKNLESIVVDEPTYLTTIDPTNLYSESLAIHCAKASGMIKDLVGEEVVQTVSGRMSSKEFDFNISTISGGNKKINVENSQIEIDGGFESDSYFTIIEAKKETVDDFLIRQLYYPYRLWEGQTDKKIRPVFFTHSNDTFSFFVYEFTEIDNYNSLKLIEQKNYTFVNEVILLEDILEVFESVKLVKEPKIPFPQANSIIRLLDLLDKLQNEDLQRDMITLNYDFDVRQTSYYTDAGGYLGLIEKYYVKQFHNKKVVMYKLTNEGHRIMQLSPKQRKLTIVKKILEHKPFYRTFKLYLENFERPNQNVVAEILQDSRIYNINKWSTFYRRSSTVLKWIDWILALKDEE